MRWPRVAFVAAPEVDAEVRFDFNDDLANTYPAADNFSLGVPDLLGDPDGIGVEYGLRALSFTLVVESSRAEALRAQSALAREVLRRTNWLLFQLDETSAPVWFKTWRGEPGDLSFEHVYNERGRDHWQVGVEIPAEPFAYGERVDVPDATVTNNPLAATNPMSFVIPEVKGDAPAPLAFATYPNERIRSRVMVSAIPLDSFTAPRIVTAADAFGFADVSAPVASTSYATGSYREVSFTTSASMQLRFSCATNDLPAGSYRVLARLVRTDTTSTFDVRCDVESGVPYGDVVTLSGTSAGEWGTLLDLGILPLPMGLPPESSFDLDTTTGQRAFFVHAARTSGTGRLRLDYFLLVPVTVGEASATTIVADIQFDDYGAPRAGAYFDGENEAVVFGSTPATANTISLRTPPPLVGGFPSVQPGHPNVVFVLPHVDDQVRAGLDGVVRENRDTITETTDVLRCSYRPRYLYLGSE